MSGAALSATALQVAVPAAALASSPIPLDGPAWINGDPSLAHSAGVGLGGSSFDEMRHEALSMRLPSEERDRYLLGLEEEGA